MENCIFCKIIAGEAPASKVYEDELCMAFLDIQPITPGHVLVIPKEHAVGLGDLRLEVGGHLFTVAQAIAAAIRASELKCDGINLHLADGAIAGQDVFHVHLHVVPRFQGDGFGFRRGSWEKPDRAELDWIAAGIKNQLDGKFR
jgi:diadenosine tetraphosphate (Ap4A) HIT family hydrolase